MTERRDTWIAAIKANAPKFKSLDRLLRAMSVIPYDYNNWGGPYPRTVVCANALVERGLASVDEVMAIAIQAYKRAKAE